MFILVSVRLLLTFKIIGRCSAALAYFIFGVSRVMEEYLLAQGCGVDVRIDFSGANTFVPQHHLNGAKVGPTLEQFGGERVAKGVRRDGFLDASRLGLAFQHDENHGASKMSTTAIEEHIVLFTGFYLHQIAVEKPKIQFFDGFGRDGYESFFVALAGDADEAFVQIKIGKLQVDQL